MKLLLSPPPIVRFGAVGLLATLTNSVAFVILASFGLSGVLSALLAYCVAFWVSYFGHSKWTFGGSGKVHRFAATSLFGLAINTSISFAIVDVMGAAPWIAALLMIIITPPLTYIIMKLWVFSSVR